MENTVKNTNSFKITNRAFDINFDELKTLEDIKSILKALQIVVNIHSDEIPEHLIEIFSKGFLLERK